MAKPERTERLGVSKLDYFFSSYGWLFREQYLHDHGIDAQVEITDSGMPTGNLIAIQVKSGKSYFAESTDTSFIFRTDDSHIAYWTQHCLPVIVVLHDPDKDILYWESVSEKSSVSTGKGWKISVPKNKHLTEESLHELCALTQPPPYIQKINKLRLDKFWMDLVAEGECVYIEFEDWINKSLPRFGVTIGCDSRDDIEEQSWPTIYGIGLSMEEVIAYTVPWADFETDEDAYRDFMESNWFTECYMGRDKEDDIEFFSEPFEDWYKSPSEKIVPVSDNGETVGYRLLLTLNELGKAFHILNEYLEENDQIQYRIFTLDI